MATPTKFQPTIPTQTGGYTEAEQNFIDETPPNIFPENQESNWGFKRMIFCNTLQEAIEQLNTIYNERFIDSTVVFLDEWEEQMGVPIAPTNFTTGDRKAVLKSRLQKGGLSRAHIQKIVEQFIIATTGESTALTPDGLVLDASGLTLYSEPFYDVSTLYRIYENPLNFSYEVWIRSDYAANVKQAALLRELTHFTPAGITVSVDYSHANILDYNRTVLTDGPSAYWRLASTTDQVGSNNLTANGAPTTVTALCQNSSANDALNLNGTSQYLSMSTSTRYLNPLVGLGIEAWIKPSSVTGIRTIVQRGTWRVYIDAGVLKFEATVNGGSIKTLIGPTVSVGTVYHVFAQFDGNQMELWVNGSLGQNFLVIPGAATLDDSGVPLEVGRGTGATNFYAGDVDEVTLYSHNLPGDRITVHSKTGINVA